MPRKSFTIEQIISKLREAEVLLGQGQNVGDICRSFNISEQTYYRWRKEYGGIRTDQARRLKDLEKENARLKKLVADITLDNAILKEVLSETDQPGQAQAGSGTRTGGVPGFRTSCLPGIGTTSLHPTISWEGSR